jgi:hypothetical protein
MNEERLLKFLEEWRARLLRKPHEHRSDEEFGQLITLNTIIWFIQNP